MLQKSLQDWLRLLIVLALVIGLFKATTVMMPFLLGLILSFVLYPLVVRIERTCENRLKLNHLPRCLAILLAFIVFLCVAVLIIMYILMPFISEFAKFIHNIPELLQQFGAVLWNLQHEQLNVPLAPQVEFLINEGLVKLGNYTVDLAKQSLSFVFSFAGVVVELLLVPIVAFYFLKDGIKIKQCLVSLFPIQSQRGVRHLLKEMQVILSSYLCGQLILATNMFIVVFIAMTFFEIPYPLVLSFLAAIAEWVPIIGPILGATPAIILSLLIEPALALKVTLFYLIIQFIDAQIIMPKIMGTIISLHPIVIIAVIFLGGSFYGITGMVLAVPTTALLQRIIKHIWYFDKYFKGKGDIV